MGASLGQGGVTGTKNMIETMRRFLLRFAQQALPVLIAPWVRLCAFSPGTQFGHQTIAIFAIQTIQLSRIGGFSILRFKQSCQHIHTHPYYDRRKHPNNGVVRKGRPLCSNCDIKTRRTTPRSGSKAPNRHSRSTISLDTVFYTFMSKMNDGQIAGKFRSRRCGSQIPAFDTRRCRRSRPSYCPRARHRRG
jgi:hypothetical protein